MATLRRIMLFLVRVRLPPCHRQQESTPDIEVITDADKKVFAVSETEGKLLVKQYDNDFEEWIDIDVALVAKDKQKLKIVANTIVVHVDHSIHTINMALH